MSILDEELRGVLAAIASPLCMAIGFIVWDKTWKGSSAFSLNLFKCNFASIIFVVAGFIFGFVLNRDLFSLEHVGWLILSGILGIIIGDWLWLEALQRLGAFQVLVIDTIKPFCAALMGHFLLEERRVHPIAYAAMFLTVSGVLVVSMEQNKLASLLDDELKEDELNTTRTGPPKVTDIEKPSSIEEVSAAGESKDGDDGGKENADDEEAAPIGGSDGQNTGAQDDMDPAVVQENQTTSYRKVGYVLAVANVVLDTYGSLLTKQHGWNFTTWGINLIRFGCSGLLMAIVSVILSLYKYQCASKKSGNDDGAETTKKEREWYQLPSKTTRMWAQVCVGVVFVTFLCPALSNYALFQIPLAYALTLTSIAPLYALFLEWAFWGPSKRPTFLALLGSSMAVGGVVWLGILNSQANER